MSNAPKRRSDVNLVESKKIYIKRNCYLRGIVGFVYIKIVENLSHNDLLVTRTDNTLTINLRTPTGGLA